MGGHWGLEGDVTVGWEMVIWGRCQGEGTVMRTVPGIGGGDREQRWEQGSKVGQGLGQGAK